MSSVRRIQFSTTIHSPPATVWRVMTSPESYRRWAAAFMEGCYFEGSWEQGAKIRFLAPPGDGMVSEIAENRTNQFISIRHLGFTTQGVEDTTSEAIRSWLPAYENYTFVAVPEGTKLVVDLDVASDFEQDMKDAWPKALDLIKQLSERAA
ncbi:MAG: SRPBCC domain-containing protein [Rhodocyclaceae bacterium]